MGVPKEQLTFPHPRQRYPCTYKVKMNISRNQSSKLIYLENRLKLMLDIHQLSKTLVVKHKECSASLSKVKTLLIVFLTLLLFDTDCCFEAQNVTASVSFANVYFIQKYGMFLRGNFELKVETCGITAGLRVIFFTLTDKVVT